MDDGGSRSASAASPSAPKIGGPGCADRSEARRRKTVTDIDAEIARLKEQRKEVRARSVERLSRIALETGLADLRCRTNEIETAFKEFACRFRGKAADRPGLSRPTPSAARDGTGEGGTAHSSLVSGRGHSPRNLNSGRRRRGRTWRSRRRLSLRRVDRSRDDPPEDSPEFERLKARNQGT